MSGGSACLILIVPVRAANLHFQGVDVPAGSHSMVIAYEPFSFRAGFFVTLLTIMLIGIGVAGTRPGALHGNGGN